MPTFAYQVRDVAGITSTGVLNATNPMEASSQLRTEGKVVLSLHEKAAGASASAVRPRRIKKEEVLYFATQLAVMVDTGVTLSEALDSIAEQSEDSSLQLVIQDISEQVKGGMEFSVALERHPRVFHHLFVALMRASEASGTMGSMLQRLSEYMEQQRETRKRIKGAMTYPIMMLSFCVLVVIGLMVFIMPRFEKIYASKNALLPMPTRILMGASNFLVTYWPILLGFLAVGVIGLWYYLCSPAGRLLLDRTRIRLPILGKMYRQAYLARSLRTMATMITSGVSMLEGLEITVDATGNHEYKQLWKDVSQSVKEGQALSEKLFESSLIPRTITRMIASGERSGRLGPVMNRVAQFCEDELKISVRTVTSLVEPLMILIMGVIVGGVAMALLLPVFSISRVVAH